MLSNKRLLLIAISLLFSLFYEDAFRIITTLGRVGWIVLLVVGGFVLWIFFTQNLYDEKEVVDRIAEKVDAPFSHINSGKHEKKDDMEKGSS